MVNLNPKSKDEQRVQNYKKFEKLFKGEHLDAFRIQSPQSDRQYQALRYVATNFAGMLSKLSADMLFMEFPKISVANEKANKFVDAMIFANKLKTQFYESALENSYRGDATFRIRSKDDNTKLVIEDFNPEVYEAEYNKNNVRSEPTAHILKWKMELTGKKDSNGKPVQAIFREVHRKGLIENQLWEIDSTGNFVAELDVKAYLNIDPIVETGIDEFLIVHIPNFHINSDFYGISDYYDLMSLMYAINNRITKTDNILDKHGDPILAVPPGVLDEEGKVRKESFGVIEVDTSEAGGAKPEYIVWDAKLESAFKQVENLVNHLFLTSETSLAAFGLDKNGQAESGRALKFKLLRTIAKKKRKELYFDDGIKQLLYVAQLFAKAQKLECGGVKMTGTAEVPQIEWQDGVVNDALEQIELEEKKLDNDLTTTKDAISRIDGISDKEAEEKVKEIDEENKKKAPQFDVKPAFGGGEPQKNNEK